MFEIVLEKTLTKTRFNPLLWIGSLALVVLALPALGTNTALDQTSFLYPEERHENIGELITQFIEKQHYNNTAVDDELSSKVLDLFIESLDRNRVYLLEGDIEFFETYRYGLRDVPGLPDTGAGATRARPETAAERARLYR